MKILVIDDDAALCRSLQIHLERGGHSVELAHNAADGIAKHANGTFDLTFVDLKLPDKSGLEVLKSSQNVGGGLAVMITGTQDMKATIEAVRLGAFDYIRKPLDLDAVLLTVEKARQESTRAVGKTKTTTEAEYQPREIVGGSPKTTEVIKHIGLLSQSRIPVLILGESGTGKELVARALHEATSPGKPFIAINCSSVVSTLLESELFGHVRGAFTGADSDKVGRLELAGEGTVFFDEIGDMAIDLQAKLLRAIQERSFERVGGVKSIPLRARIVAATHRNLESMVASGAFREDLYYRLAVSTVSVPPLRERREDIPLLSSHLLARLCRELHRPITSIQEKAMRRLQAYDWPGNVRELENVLTRAALLTRGDTLLEQDVVASLGSPLTVRNAPQAPIKTLRDAERDYVEIALYSTGWNATQTAAILDISPTTLRKKIHDYGLIPPREMA
ncbi:MAG: sigma-54-dependent Fis family transcriptional regulator [Candidatus Hydrogenedentes bacterium]|nr:sigma-54-dependent Fis family transcriptional regulator [Candidatus Hydrogenedentota bacterium]